MLRKSIADYSPDQVRQLARQVVFLRHLADQDPTQFAALMARSQIVELEPGEVLIEKGTLGDEFYALAQGQLAIFPERRLADTAICELMPGQVVGALSMLNRQPRSATVAVSGIDGAQVFALPFAVFGRLDEFGCVSLDTKLRLFREVVEHILSTLHHFERIAPDVVLSGELYSLAPFDGRAGSFAELEYLAEMAGALAWLLDCWNQRMPARVEMFSEASLEQRLAGLLRRPAETDSKHKP